MQEMELGVKRSYTKNTALEALRTMEKSGAKIYPNVHVSYVPASYAQKIIKVVDMNAEYSKMQDWNQLDPNPELIDNLDYLYIDGKKHYGNWVKKSVIPAVSKLDTNTEAVSVKNNTNSVNTTHKGLNNI